MSRVDIDLDDEETLQRWAALGELAERLPGEWTLIRQESIAILDGEVSVEQVSDTQQTRHPILVQRPTGEVLVRPAVSMKHDEPREVHKLLLAEDCRPTRIAQLSVEKLSKRRVSGNEIDQPVLQLSIVAAVLAREQARTE